MVELTFRQQQIYELLKKGSSYSEIGVELGLSPRTIGNYVKALADRLPGNGPPLRKILRDALEQLENDTKV